MGLLNLSTNIFGLDIGDLSLKVAFLKKRGKRIELKTYGEKILPPDYFFKGEIKKEKEVAQTIKKFIEEKNISTPYVIAVLPETKTFIKTIEILSSDVGDVLETIKKEIEQHIPLELEEVYFDWQRFSQNGKSKILVGLAPKSIVDSYVRILKMAGLKPVALEIESIAILRALIDKNEELMKPRIIIDFGATRSSLIIVDEGTIQLTISLPFSGEDLTKEIATKLKISLERAEKIKKEMGKENKDKILEEIVYSFLNNLTTTLGSHINFYEENSKRKIEEIIICGGGANLFKLDSFLEENLKIKVKKGNPFQKIFKKNSSLSEEDSLVYTTAIGLALRGLEEKI